MCLLRDDSDGKRRFPVQESLPHLQFMFGHFNSPLFENSNFIVFYILHF